MIVRKRTVIALFISIASLVLTNRCWLTYQPISVSANISGSGKCKIEVQLNKKDNDEFNKVRSSKIDINLDETDNVKSEIKNSRKPKRIKFIFSDIESENPINLSNIQIENTKLDINKFTVQNGDCKFSENSLILYPEYGDIILTSSEKLSNKAKIKFEIELFISILILSFLFAYKLSDYVANFETIKGKSRIEIIFLTIFFIFLFIPMSHISNEEISTKENRTLAKWKPFVEEKEINYEFGKDFNAWYNDRFALRKLFVDINKIIRRTLTTNIYSYNNIYYNKKTGWAFSPDWFITEDITPKLPEIISNLKKLKNFCDKNNISLYILVAPVTAEIYPDEVKPFTVKTENGKIFEKEINEKVADIVLFPKSALIEASKTDYTYVKTDPHWGEYGGYIANNEVIKKMRNSYPNLELLTEDDFEITKQKLPVITDYEYWITDDFSGFYYKSLGIKNKQEYTTFKFKYLNDFKVLNQDNYYMKIDSFLPRAKNPQKVYLIGTSYSENLYRFLRYSFRHVIKRKINNLAEEDTSLNFSRWKKDILKENPDILLFVIQSNDLKKYCSLWQDDKLNED